jgi:predicted RNase H-like HicB family nuclease
MVVHVLYHRDEDTWVVSCPQIPRWTAVADSYQEAHRLAEEGVRFALDREDLTVEHFVPAGTAVPA